MHNLTTYINDMRIIMIVLIVLGAIAGAVYLLMRQKKKQSKKQKYRLAATGKGRQGAAVDDEQIAAADPSWTKEIEARGKSGAGGFQLNVGHNLGVVEGSNGNKGAHL